MAEDELAKMVIPEIPPEEKILKEGVLRSIELKKKTPIVFHYKYAITEKGIWTRNEKRLLNKSKTVFAAFADLDDYEVIAHKMGECCAFNRKNGKAVNGVFFDDHEGVVRLLDEILYEEDTN